MVTTTKFALLTDIVAAGFGMPETRVLVVEHPLGGTDEATVARWADAAVDRAIALLTGQDAP